MDDKKVNPRLESARPRLECAPGDGGVHNTVEVRDLDGMIFRLCGNAGCDYDSRNTIGDQDG